jgi:type II secretory pathway component GspD/PulD (secretin)
VRPTISNDRKYVTLEMEPTVADLKTPIPTFTTNLGGLSFPVTIEIPELNISKAGTRVIVPDGGSVVMGGLKRIRSVDRKSETPILSDLPLVGFLFSRRGKSEEIEDLILIVTVHINDMLEGERKLAGM